MPYALDERRSPLLLMSGLAVHAKNLAADGRASLLVMQADDGETDPVEMARVTIMGDVREVPEDEHEAAKRRYLLRHPASAQWIEFGDFRVWRMLVADVYYVGGFGAMGWLSVGDYEAG